MALHNHPQAGTRTTPQTHWEIDPENTTVEFTIGKSRLNRVRGQFHHVHGSAVELDDQPNSATIEVEIDAASVDTGIRMRDWHLRTAQFLKIKRFHTISFRSACVQELGQDRLQVFGELTIRGIVRKVTLDATVEHRDSERIQITASTVLDRRDFKIGPKPMGLMVGNDIAIQVALVLHAQESSAHSPSL
jgi:polyisoprenoid-binding protein YceI